MEYINEEYGLDSLDVETVFLRGIQTHKNLSKTTKTKLIYSDMSSNSTEVLNENRYYNYVPTMGASILFILLFFLETVILTFLVIQHSLKSKRKIKRWSHLEGIRYFLTKSLGGAYIPLLLGCLGEFIGYIGRCLSAKDRTLFDPFLQQTICLLIMPAFYAGSIYMLFGRMAHLLFAEKIMLLPVRFNTTFFVVGDVFSLVLQAAGGGIMAGSDGDSSLGKNITIGGLFVQIAFFGLFVINEFLFIFKVDKNPNDLPRKCKIWKSLNINLLVNSFLILIRSIVRVIEFVQGDDGVIVSHEWFLYVFDSFPMFVLPLIFIFTFHTSNIFMVQEESVEYQIQSNFSNSDDDYDIKPHFYPEQDQEKSGSKS